MVRIALERDDWVSFANGYRPWSQTAKRIRIGTSRIKSGWQEIITEFQKLSLLFKEWPKSQNQQQQQERQTG